MRRLGQKKLFPRVTQLFQVSRENAGGPGLSVLDLKGGGHEALTDAISVKRNSSGLHVLQVEAEQLRISITVARVAT